MDWNISRPADILDMKYQTYPHRNSVLVKAVVSIIQGPLLSHMLVSICTYFSTGRKHASIKEICLISNNIPPLGKVLHLEL